MIRASKSGFIYDFNLYCGKEDRPPADYDHFSASAQSVARLCSNLPRYAGKQIFFDNWFTTLDLLLYLIRIGLQAVRTVRANGLQGFPLISVKGLKKQEKGAVDSRAENNSGLVIVRWLNNSIVQLASNFVVASIKLRWLHRWCQKTKASKAASCPKIVSMYNGNMDEVYLADILISLYRIEAKTHRWYIKVFWHMVGIAKINA